MTEPGAPVEVLISISRGNEGTLTQQIETQLRAAVREGSLRPGTKLPSTRALADQLGVSRRIVVEAYTQLASEGYLELRQGAAPRVSTTPGSALTRAAARPAAPEPRYDFRPSRPDVTSFPRAAWSRCLREAVRSIPTADLLYGDPCGLDAFRTTVAGYLGRVRGVVATPEHVVATGGYLQGLGLVCEAMAARGARTIALEDPCSWEEPRIAARAGLEVVRLPVDEQGARTDLLSHLDPDVVVLTPAHQHPIGVVLSPERRQVLARWLAGSGAVVVEDDYDAEYRYDRPAVGALQGIAPDRVVYAGTLSKVLAPALRLGWLVVPGWLLDDVRTHKQLADQGTPRIEQLAFASFLDGGHLDRHLRAMRLLYRSRRDTIVAALASQVPQATVGGIAAGLHVTVTLPPDHDEQRIRTAARERAIEIGLLGDYHPETPFPPTLILGYPQLTDRAIAEGVTGLAAAIRAGRASSTG
jgi:GntR family transcriptional regulator / MocR family aminotransferase